MRALWKATVGALAIMTAMCGCTGDGSSSGLDEAELGRLRSLPYVGSTPIKPGEEAEGVVLHDQARSYPGYTLYTVQYLAMAVLIDQIGDTVKVWHHPPSVRWERTDLLPNGDLMIIGVDGDKERFDGIPDSKRYMARLSWDGRLLWKRQMTAHHDVELNPNGEIAVLAFARRQIPTMDSTTDIRDDLLVLLDDEGGWLDDRSLIQAFSGRDDIHSVEIPASTTLGGRPWIDIFHSNSIEWMRHSHLEDRHEIYAPGNILICSRNQNCIAVVNWETGKVIWAWGAGELSGPHDAQVLENGNILLFDNGLGRGWSRVIELNPVTKTIVWEFKDPVPHTFYSRTKGSCQRLPNGNTLIADSDHGEAFEVTQDGEIVWRFVCPHEIDPGSRAAIVRAVRYERDFIESLIAEAGR